MVKLFSGCFEPLAPACDKPLPCKQRPYLPRRPSRQFYPLLAAALSLDASGQAAVGWCYEYQHDEHRCTAEGSVWLLLEHNAEHTAKQGATMRVRQNRATTNSESAREDGYYWQAVCDELARQPENERVLQAGDWELLIDAANWEYAQETIGMD